MKQEKLESLAQELAACRECPLREAAQAPVGWFGNYDSPIVFVGEGPGGVEDDYGCPLIGVRLDSCWIRLCGLPR